MQKNKPLTRDEVQALPVLRNKDKDKKGNEVTTGYALSYQHRYPNNRMRRMEKQRGPHRNAKQNNARHYQDAPVVVKEKRKFGTVNIPTGWFKRIMHLRFSMFIRKRKPV